MKKAYNQPEWEIVCIASLQVICGSRDEQNGGFGEGGGKDAEEFGRTPHRVF